MMSWNARPIPERLQQVALKYPDTHVVVVDEHHASKTCVLAVHCTKNLPVPESCEVHPANSHGIRITMEHRNILLRWLTLYAIISSDDLVSLR